MRIDQIIVEPVLTEKTNALRDLGAKKYVFKVHAKANKFQIMSAVNQLFKVKPTDCNIINVDGKAKTSRTKQGLSKGRTSSWKKAIVTLAKGDKIDAFEGV